jgi:branched-chain amino acid transport system substrate-binding protein
MERRRIGIAGIAISCCLACLMASACSGGSGGNTIKVGHIISLTGTNSIWTQAETNGLKMKIEEINGKGGVLGKKLELVEADIQSNPNEVVNATRKLLQQHVVAIIGPTGTNYAMPVLDIMDQEKVPLIATTATNPKVTVDQKTGKVHPYVFRVCFIDPYQGKIEADYVFSELKVKTAAILYDVGSPYSDLLAKVFEQEFVQVGGKIVDKEAYNGSELEFRAQLGKIKNAKPEIIFSPTGNFKDGAMILKQARDLGITTPFMAADSWNTDDLIKMAGTATEGSYFSAFGSLKDPELQAMANEYKTKYNIEPLINSYMAPDALLLLCDAITRAGKIDSQLIRDEIEKTKDLQVITSKLTIDPATHDPLGKPVIINTVRDGKIEFVKKFIPNS